MPKIKCNNCLSDIRVKEIRWNSIELSCGDIIVWCHTEEENEAFKLVFKSLEEMKELISTLSGYKDLIATARKLTEEK